MREAALGLKGEGLCSLWPRRWRGEGGGVSLPELRGDGGASSGLIAAAVQ